MKILIISLLGLLWASGAYALERTALEAPTANNSMAPRLAALDDGQAVLSWLERLDNGHRLRFARFDGSAFGPASTIASGRFFANWADTPGVFAVPDDGPWLAHWLQRSGQGTYAYDVVAAISNDEGESWSAPFSPHDDGTPTEHGFVSYFAPGDARAGLAWLDGRETLPAAVDRDGGHAHGHDHHGHGHGGAMTLRTAQVDAQGRLHEEALLDDRVCDCCGTASAMTDDGPIVAYRDRSDEEIRDIMVVRQTTDGWSEPALVHADGWHIAGCPVNGPTLIARGQQVVAAWFTMGDDGTPRVRLAQSRDGGRSFGLPLEIDTGEAIGRVELAWKGDGFLLGWLSTTEGGMLRLARFDAEGKERSRHDVQRLDGGRSSGFPRLLALDAEQTLLAWTDADPETRDPRVRVTVLRFED